MAYNARANTDMHRDNTNAPGRLSQTGQMIGWGVFGGLVFMGFFFGVVTGYERPKPPTQVTAAPKETTRVEAPKLPKKEEPKAEPPREDPPPPKKEEPKPEEPKVEPPKVDPPKVESPPPPKKEPPKTTVAVSFQKDVLPIFRTYCLNCHGTGTGKPRGDVDLRTVASIMKGGGGPIIEVGKPEKSAIYTSIVDNAMPPEGKRPGKGETDVIRDWILGGAKPRRPARGPAVSRPASRVRSRSRTPRPSGTAS
jgi:hypothetical protein